MFSVPTDSTSVKLKILPVPFEARYVRVNPQSWQNDIAMQLEIYRCAELQPTTTSSPLNFEGKNFLGPKYKHLHYSAIFLLLSGACDMEMGMGDGRLQDSQISASSVLNGDTANYGPQLARLNGLAAWRPNHNTRSEWIMV